MKTACLFLALATPPSQAPQDPGVEAPQALPATAVPSSGSPIVDVRDPRQPKVQARNILTNTGLRFRGVSAYVPRDANGNRYYYSHSVSPATKRNGYSETKIESWSDQTGRPIAALYSLESSFYRMELSMKIEKDRIVFDETVQEGRGRPKFNHVEVPIDPGLSIQLSQFHPMDVRLDPNGVAEFTLVDPIAKRADRARLVKAADDHSEFSLASIGPVYRYRIENTPVRSEIEIAHDGTFRRVADTKGYVMTADTPTEDEQKELRLVVTRAYRHGEGADIPSGRPPEPIVIGGGKR